MYKNVSLADFCYDLSSNSPAPGGGGASALIGAIGAALGSMVANLTTGKKKYAEYEEDIQRILVEAEELRLNFLAQIDEDEEGFVPLSRAYSLPKDDPSYGSTMENALKAACTPPMHIMETAAKGIKLQSELAIKGSTIMQSDVGVGVLALKSALLGASLNIFINAKTMKDIEYKEELLRKTNELIEKYTKLADETYAKVLAKIM